MTDRDAFARLLTAYQWTIYTCVRSLLANRAGVEEVWQETNVVLWQKADQYQPGTNFRAWVLAVARFEVQNFRRQNAGVACGLRPRSGERGYHSAPSDSRPGA